MSYGPQAIQPEGWLFSITKENRSRPAKPCQSKRGPKKKERARSTCDHCGTRFEVQPGAVGKYCSHDCMHESKLAARPSWYPCSKCLAKVGIGITVQSRLFRVSKATISRQWGKDGIKAQVPPDRSWKHYAASRGGFAYNQNCWWGPRIVAEAWMAEYTTRFFDWSSIATAEINKKKHRQYQAMMHRTSSKNSNYRLKKIARSRIYNAIKRLARVDQPRIRYRTERMIGCTIEQLASHLQSKFKKGMSWANHGTVWHIDHIIPMAEFDLADEKQLLQCCHYTNLQPMMAGDNLKKSAKLQENVQMSLLLCATH